MKKLTLFANDNCQLQLFIDGPSSGELRFLSNNNEILITKDNSLYIVGTLLKSISNILSDNSIVYERKDRIPLGIAFNRYSFELWRSTNRNTKTDPVDNYLVFGDENCLIMYKRKQEYFFEISTIYSEINNLEVGFQEFEIWLKSGFFSRTIKLEVEHLHELSKRLNDIYTELIKDS